MSAHLSFEVADVWLAKLETGRMREPLLPSLIWTLPMLAGVHRSIRFLALSEVEAAQGLEQ
ncbi:hypothetical protein AJ87_44405 [Rhizobium yanglingense]|nr:hypothetical protein AJ87_44405 [Rhizobium yanglingense]